MSNNSNEMIFQNIKIVGIYDKLFDVKIKDGLFSSVQQSNILPANNKEQLWISPGLIDLHTHLAWTDFHHDDQLKRSTKEVEQLQVKTFNATFELGITTTRDAGGLSPTTLKHIQKHYKHALKVFTSGDPLGANDAKGFSHLEKRIDEIIRSGATWIKIFATGGLGAPPEKVLESFFSLQELSFIVRKAHERNIKVLVHSWGGPSIDWSIEAGVDSIEHGIYLTEDQAHRIADVGIALIPTASIYQIAADPSGPLELNAIFCDRAARAAEAHAKAIHYAKRAGVRIGFGTDYSTPSLNGRNLEELDVLIDYGLTRNEVWHAATVLGAEVLGYNDKLGRIAEGYIADAVVFKQDPLKVKNAAILRESIVSVHTGVLP